MRTASLLSLLGLLGAAGACSSAPAGPGRGGASTTSTASGGAASTSAPGGGGSGGATTSSTGGGSAGGGAGGCVPGEEAPCYTGPEGTLGVGPCKAGVATCNATGIGYGPCVGEVTPKFEVCSTPEDEDCSGQPNDGCVCEPFSEEPCYTGPPGTLDVGTCHAGYHVCKYTGKDYGSCISEITPGVENCASAADEDCDGTTPPCIGNHVSSRAFGGEAVALATDLAGHMILGGAATGPVDVGCGPLAGGAAEGGVIARLDPAGACLWSKRLPDGTRVTGVGADTSNNVYLAGTMTGTVDLGGGPMTSAGLADVLIAKLDPNGNLVWARRVGGVSDDIAAGLVVDESNSPVVVGHFEGAMDVDGSPLVSQGGKDVFLIKLDAAGGTVWVRSYGDAQDQVAAGVAVDPAYEVIVAGSFEGTIDLGGGPLVSAGQRDVFVAKLDSAGEHLYSRSFGDGLDQRALAVAVDRSGDVFVAGAFAGTMDLGGSTLTSAGGDDAFLIALAPEGAHQWSRSMGDASAQAGVTLAIDPFGNVALGAAMQGAADFGGGALTSAGGVDMALAKYDPLGAFLWSHRFGGVGDDAPRALTFLPSGALRVAGAIGSAVDFGGGVVGGGGEGACLVEMAP
jgi:hypothetical protein